MKKHEQPTHRLEKMSNFFGGSNFSKLNLYPCAIMSQGKSMLIGMPSILSQNLGQNQIL